MSLRKAVRESAFNLARRDLAIFLEEHEEDLIKIFREEMQQLDDDLPEEAMFIDLNLVGIGDMILKAALHAIRRFLREVPDKSPDADAVTRSKNRSEAEVKPVENVPFWKRKS
ncbi:MAG: hypothetical protein ACP5J4_16060 [Anaerolineae bacterium]